MKKFGIEFILKPLCFGNTKGLNNKVFSFASIKKIKDSKQSQLKKEQTNDSKLIKTETNLKSQQKNDPKKQSTQNKSVMTKEQKKDLLFKQKVQITYQELQSLPSDSYETVVQNFKKIKGKLMDRKVYIPNKPELMAKLDHDMQFIKQHHKIWRAPTTSPQRLLSDNKGQVIEWQLQQAKKKYYLSFLENEKILIGCALTVILVFGWMEYSFFIKEEDKREQFPKMFI